jgi:hypothetical protein
MRRGKHDDRDPGADHDHSGRSDERNRAAVTGSFPPEHDQTLLFPPAIASLVGVV